MVPLLTRISNKLSSLRFRLVVMVAISMGVLLPATSAWGQSNFGGQSIGVPSSPQSIQFTVPAGTTVGSIGVMTEGSPNLDFADAGGDTCTATSYGSSTNCTVNVSFTPSVAGLRAGAVVFFSGSNNTGTELLSMPV